MDRRHRRGVIVPLASHAVAGRVAHINWYYYGPERQYCSRVAHITLLVVWTPFERIFKRKYSYVGEPWTLELTAPRTF